MNARSFLLSLGLAAFSWFGTGCANKLPAVDYTNFRAHPPRSILVLPPLNQSTAVEATYGYLTAVTRPLAEMGYYVFPVSVVDQLLKENGMPTAGEMHQVPLQKVKEIVGADSVLYVTVLQYGSKYQVVNSATLVSVKAKLVDTSTGILLWEGQAAAQANSGGTGNIIGDLISAAITQAVNTSADRAHDLAGPANALLFGMKDRGLLYGPRHPQFGKQK